MFPPHEIMKCLEDYVKDFHCYPENNGEISKSFKENQNVIKFACRKIDQIAE